MTWVVSAENLQLPYDGSKATISQTKAVIIIRPKAIRMASTVALGASARCAQQRENAQGKQTQRFTRSIVMERYQASRL